MEENHPEMLESVDLLDYFLVPKINVTFSNPLLNNLQLKLWAFGPAGIIWQEIFQDSLNFFILISQSIVH